MARGRDLQGLHYDYFSSKERFFAAPDRYLPFMEPDPWGDVAADFQRFTYGPTFRFFRRRNLEKRFEVEPEWRKHGPRPTSGYVPHDADATAGPG